ncbi:MAG: hypothetical protein KDA90_22260 [Planctomycetaceae bacterium]|nr:hypothetical protein [Planctomycetaceae bacterium]
MQSNLFETLAVGGRRFRFKLCRKPDTALGPATVDHWWMPVTEVYAQRQRKNQANQGNHRAVLDFYWACCQQERATNERDAQERFLLAGLLPMMRSDGGRRIFADAFPARGTQLERSAEIENLELAIRSQARQTLSWDGFRNRTRDALTPRTEYSADQREQYTAFVHGLLDEACQLLERGDVQGAMLAASTNWSDLIRTYGRRKGHQDIKLILDILSYEGRAAFHHAYSLVWSDLIPFLAARHGISDPTAAFLRFWHQDWIRPDQSNPNCCYSLFHGHVFALHPCGARFLLTPSGQRLLGNWLIELESNQLLEQVLHGLSLSAFEYRRILMDRASLRPDDQVANVSEIEDLHAQDLQNRSGHRRLPGPRSDD